MDRIRKEKPLIDQLIEQVPVSKLDALRGGNVPWQVEFRGEQGIDAGGLRRELLLELAAEIQRPEIGLFMFTPNGRNGDQPELIPVPGNDLKLQYAGVIVALSVTTGFAEAYRVLCTGEVEKKDVYACDKALAEFIGTLRECSNPDDLTALNLNFACEDWAGQLREVVPGGVAQMVEWENREKFCSACEQMRIDELRTALVPTRHGFRAIVASARLSWLDASDLKRAICGDTELTAERLKGVIVIEEGREYSERFFEVLGRLNTEDRTQFLKFVTATSGLPPLGFPQPKITVSIQSGHDFRSRTPVSLEWSCTVAQVPTNWRRCSRRRSLMRAVSK
jgi:E3 ubiquitin-protein ligase HECTD2